MSLLDEPVLGSESTMDGGDRLPKPELRQRIARLLEQEPFAVLATQGGGQPYGSVVAFAAGQDLKAITFATPITTRKYRLLSGCDQVALVVDNRDRFPADMMRVEALTATGRAERLEPGPEFDRWGEMLVKRHPYLKHFVHAPTSALFRIHIIRYLHVTRFQEVNQWIPE